MAQIKCKMCGGSIEIIDGQTTVECEFCGQEQTIPKIDNEKKATLFNRANVARFKCDFDAALRYYESILLEYPNEPEAHWGVCLSRYGIEYVDDPATKKKIPTCHRTLFNSIFDDVDYKEAIAKSDVVAKKIYQAEAEKIDKIQKGILAISQREEPYDIFICYKETDDAKKRTRDSVIAQDIYDELAGKGYKVFFARITLESKLGSQYEPIIFAALQSAKLMLVIGSKQEYFNATWVKNEWSRFLSFMQEGKGKYLIPCYRDMEAYDLPTEFLSLQAQNMDKLGFKQDLLRGIDKIFGREEKKVVVQERQAAPTKTLSQDFTVLITTMFELKNYEKAEEYCLKALEEDTTNPFYWYMQGCSILSQDVNRKDKAKVAFKNCFKFGNDTEDNKYAKLIQEKYDELFQLEIDDINTEISKGNNLKSLSIFEMFDLVYDYRSLYFFEDVLDICYEDEEIDEKENDFCFRIANAIYLGLDTYYTKLSRDFSSLSIGRSKPTSDAAQRFVGNAKAVCEAANSTIKQCIERQKYTKIADVIVKCADIIVKVADYTKYVKGYANKYNAYRGIYEMTIDYSVSSTDITYFERVALEAKKLRVSIINAKEFSENKANIEKAVREIKNTNLTIDNVVATYEKYKKISTSSNGLVTSYVNVQLPKFAEKCKETFMKHYTESLNTLKNSIKDSHDKNEHVIAQQMYQKLNDTKFELISLNELKNLCSMYQTFIKESEPVYLEVHPEVVEERRQKAIAEENKRKQQILNTSKDNLAKAFQHNFNKGLYDSSMVALNSIKDFPGVSAVITEYKEKYDKYLEAERIKKEEAEKAAKLRRDKNIRTAKISAAIIIPVIIFLIILFTLIIPSVQYTDALEKANNSSTFGELEESIQILESLNGFGDSDNQIKMIEAKKALITGDYDIAVEYIYEAGGSVEITYDGNGGTPSVPNQSISGKKGKMITETASRDGYQFYGWILDNYNISLEKDNYNASITLKASWKIIIYDISWDLNGGSADYLYSTYCYTDYFLIPNPTRAGYTFKGWKEKNSNELVLDLVITKTFGNKSYTAYWEANVYTVSLDANGGTVSASEIIIDYDSYLSLPTPKKTGYKFLGWYNGETKIEDGYYSYTCDLELVAKWEEADFTLTYSNITNGIITVTYDNNYDTGFYKILTYDNDDIIQYPGTPTRSGYVFTGWYKERECNNLYMFNEVVTANLTLYAGWEAVDNYGLSQDIIDSTKYINSSSYYYDTVSSSSTSSNAEYIYTSFLTPGTKTVYYTNSNSNSSYGVYFVIYNVTRNEQISSKLVYSYSYSSTTFEVNAGDVIYIKCYSYYGYYNSNINIYFAGAETPTSTAKIDNSDVYSYESGSTIVEEIVYGHDYDLITPTRPGYTFIEWQYDGNKFESGKWLLEQDVTLTPVWERDIYTLTYNNVEAVDDITLLPTVYTYDSETFSLPNLIRSGYTFLGWTGNNITTPTKDVTISKNSIGDKEFTAHWEANEYTITYDDVKQNLTITYDYNYSSLTPKVVTYNNQSTISYSEIPTRSGYVFRGWFKESTCVNAFDFTEEITEDLTLYAGWHAASTSNYSRYIINAYQATSSNYYSYSISSSSYSGYEYYFYTSFLEAGTKTLYYKNSDGDGMYIAVYNVTQGKTILSQVYASSTSYTSVSFDANAGDVIYIRVYDYYYATGIYFYFAGEVISDNKAEVNIDEWRYSQDSSITNKVIYDTDYELPTPTREGYKFVEWRKDGVKFESGKWNLAENVTLTPYFEPEKYTITYDVAGGNELTSDTQIVTYDSSYTLKTPTRTGYKFVEWQYNGETFTSGKWNLIEDIKLKAIWEANKYTITYDVNGGHYLASNTQTVTYDSSYTLITPTRNGYKFVEWQYDGVKFESGKWNLTNDITLKAVWSLETYTITYKGLEDTIDGNEYVETYTYETESFSMPEPAKVGYRFIGWHVSGTGAYVKPGGISKHSYGNKVFTAKWEAEEYTITYKDTDCKDTITFDYNYSESTPEVVKYSHGDSISYPEIPTRSGYVFRGWFTEPTCENAVLFDEEISGGTTLYAGWYEINTIYNYKVIDPENYTTAENKVSSTIHRERSAIYFSFLESGYQYIYYNNLHSGSEYSVHLTIYNVTKNTQIISGYYATTQFSEYINVNAGDVILIEAFAYANITTLEYYFKDYNLDDNTTTVNTNDTMYEEGSTYVQTVKYGSDFELVDLQRDGYTFVEWQRDDVKFEGGTWNLTENITLTPVWSLDTYAIKYNGLENTVDSNEYVETYTYETDTFTIPNPEKTGYTFLGWTSDSITSPTLDLMIDKNSIGDLELTANWEANEYTITYEDVSTVDTVTFDYNYEGSTPTVLTYDSTSILDYPEIPERSGYVFKGWYTESTCENLFSFTEDIYYNLTLYAGWEVAENIGENQKIVKASDYTESNYYSLYVNNSDYAFIYTSFLTGGTKKIFTKGYSSSINYGINLIYYNATQDKYLVNHNFCSYTSWYEYSFDVNAGDVIYIGFSKYQYSTYFYFYFEGAEEPISTSTVYGGNYVFKDDLSRTQKVTYDAEFELVTPYRVGYDFVEWQYNGEKLEAGTWNLTEDVTLTPIWKAKEYTINYDLDGGSLSEETQTVTYDSEYELAIPTRDGYTFLGWEFEGLLFEKSEVWKYTEDITLKAIWKLNDYTITYKGIDNALDISGLHETYTYETPTITLPNLERTGYIFLGWTTEGVEDATKGLTIDKNSIGNKEFTANWKANEYTITYDVAGGDQLESSTQKVVFDEEIELAIPTMTGHTFIEWQHNGEKFEITTWDLTSDIELTAIWEATTYKVSYLVDSITYTQDVVYATDYSIPVIEKEGYTFTGYFTKANGEGEQIADDKGFALENYLFTTDLTIYASYVYTVKFATNGGTDIDSVTLKDSEKLEDKYVTTRENYTFGGWYLDANYTTKVTFNTVLSNTTIYAKWEEESPASIFTYEIVGEEVKITSISSDYKDTAVGIPTYISGYPVTTIGESILEGNTIISEITLPNTIKTICYNAFKDTVLTKVNYLGTIDGWANIVFENIYANPVVKTSDLFINDVLVAEIEITQSTKVLEFAFAGMKNISEVTIGNNVTYIGFAAFTGMSSVESITLPFVGNELNATTTSASTLFGYVFGSSSFEDATLVKQYYDASNYGSYYIPNSLTNIAITGGDIRYGAFSNLTMVTTIELSDILRLDDNFIDGCSSLEFNVYENGNYIGDEANPYLVLIKPVSTTVSSFTVHEDCKYIADNAFENCTLLQTVSLHEGLLQIGTQAFKNCSKLLEVVVPSTVEKINSAAFSGCSALTSITLPFVGRTSKTSTDTYQYPFGTIFGTASYTGGRATTQSYHASSTTSATSSTYYIPTTLRSITVLGGELNYGALQNLDRVTSITLGDRVTRIGKYALSTTSKLTSFIVGNGVEVIEANAFYNSAIKEITLSKNLKLCKTDAFNGLTALDKVYFDGSVDDWCSIKFENQTSNPMYYAEMFYTFDGEDYVETNEIEISSKVTEIGDFQFYGFDNAVSYEISNTVTKIGQKAFTSNISLSSIIIPKSVTEIGKEAFYNCTNLSKITLPFVGNKIDGTTDTAFSYIFGTLTSALKEVVVTNDATIPSSAFASCNQITKITLQKVVNIGASAFDGCTALTTLLIDDTIEKIGTNAFNRTTALQYSDYNKGYYIGNSTNQFLVLAKVTGTDITSCQINSATRVIMNNVFNGCTLLTEIKIPSHVKYIGEYAFGGCTGLTKITLPEGLKYIEKYAFSGCSKLTEVYVPKSVESIGTSAFTGCGSLETLTIPFIGQSRKNADDNYYVYPFGTIFGTSSYTGGVSTRQYYWGNKEETNSYYYIPKTLTSVTVLDGEINKGAFYGCSNIKTITLPNTISTISQSSFYNCTSLESVYYNGTIEEWLQLEFVNEYSNPARYAANVYMLDAKGQFYDAKALEELTIPKGITSVNSYAFYNFNNLKKLTVANDVTSIGKYAFNSCSSLKEVYVSETVESIGTHAFGGCGSLETITLPFVGGSVKTSEDTYQYPFGYIFGTSSYTGGSSKTQYYIGSTTTSTTNSSYYIPKSLINVTILGGYINYGAFYNCSEIKTITLPNTISTIGQSAFYNCSSLESIYLPLTLDEYLGLSIDNHWASPAYASQHVYLLDDEGKYYDLKALETVVISSAVKEIPIYAFKGCNLLKEVYIPETVETIGGHAFEGCSSLESITLPFVGGSRKTSTDTYQYPLGYIFGTNSYTGGKSTMQYYYGSSATSTTYNYFYIPTTLTEVTILDGEINYGAFYNCTNINNIYISNNVKKFNADAFVSISNLENVYYNGTLDEWCQIQFGDSDANPLTKAQAIYVLDEKGEYVNLFEMEEITISGEISELSSYAFFNMTNLKKVTVEEGVTKIGRSAFNLCSSIQSITLPNSLEEVDSFAFYKCSSLEEIHFPNSVTKFGEHVLGGCSSLKSLTLPFIGDTRKTSADENQYPLGYIFGTNSNSGCNSVSQYYYYDTVNKTYSTYYIPSSLESVTVLDANINYGAFYGCSTLKEVKLYGDSRVVGTDSFYGTNNLTDLYLACNLETFLSIDNLENIGSSGIQRVLLLDEEENWYNLYSLDTIFLDNDITKIEANAFYGCVRLEKVYYNGTLADWMNIEFENEYSNPTRYVEHLYLLDENNNWYDLKALKELTIDESITTINSNSLIYLTNLKTLYISENVTYIGESALNGCSSLKSITIPFVGDSVKTSEDAYQYPFGYIFGTNSYNSSKSVTQYYYGENGNTSAYAAYYIPNSLKEVTVLGGYINYGAFYGCDELTKITLPSDLIIINHHAFSNCSSLPTIEIPSTVTEIETGAFENCIGLTHITIPESVVLLTHKE